MIPLLALPQAAQVQTQPALPPLRAQYEWGYVGADGEGKGTLSVLLEPASGRLVLEIHGLGERLVLLSGDHASGYRVQIPRRDIDAAAPTLERLPLPFLPQLGNTEGLYRLLTLGEGKGVKVTKKDAKGPVKLRYAGEDERHHEVMVWLSRGRWELPVITVPSAN